MCSPPCWHWCWRRSIVNSTEDLLLWFSHLQSRAASKKGEYKGWRWGALANGTIDEQGCEFSIDQYEVRDKDGGHCGNDHAQCEQKALAACWVSKLTNERLHWVPGRKFGNIYSWTYQIEVRILSISFRCGAICWRSLHLKVTQIGQFTAILLLRWLSKLLLAGHDWDPLEIDELRLLRVLLLLQV